jgi:hypothetical protein
MVGGVRGRNHQLDQARRGGGVFVGWTKEPLALDPSVAHHRVGHPSLGHKDTSHSFPPGHVPSASLSRHVTQSIVLLTATLFSDVLQSHRGTHLAYVFTSTRLTCAGSNSPYPASPLRMTSAQR